jgi:hypothetical protein
MSVDRMGGAAGGPGQSRHERLDRAREVVVSEFRRYLVSTGYIFVMLSMFVLHEEIALRTNGGASQAIPYAPHGFALINALVLGKVALVVEQLRLGQRWKPEPLIYPILLESLLLAILFIAMHVLEHVIGGWISGESLVRSVPAIGGGGAFGVLFATFGFFVAMIPFCGFRQITQAIGWARMRALLFGGPAAEAGRID